MMMNSNGIFPFATIWITANAATDTLPTTINEGLVQYGLPTVLLIALGWFTFWQEKQRNKREDKSATERKDQLETLIKELHQRNQQIDTQMEWMRGQMEAATSALAKKNNTNQE